MKILILSSSSRHFPLDIQQSLKEAGLESHRLQSLNEFIASPLRKEPFLAILEVGTTEDIDRALVAYEWAETVQPLAAARYLLLVGSKHISLQEKANRFRGVEIAQLPLPLKNLMFKVELQLKVLGSEAKKSPKKPGGFTADFRGVEKERVMVIRGLGPREGGWKNSGEAPQGRTRWRWIDDPPKKVRPEESFSWSAESKVAPVFNTEIEAWEVNDDQADLQCHRDGQEIFSAKKSLAAAGAKSEPKSAPEAPPKPSGPRSAAASSAPPAPVANPALAGAKNHTPPATKETSVTAKPAAVAADAATKPENTAAIASVAPIAPEERPSGAQRPRAGSESASVPAGKISPAPVAHEEPAAGKKSFSAASPPEPPRPGGPQKSPAADELPNSRKPQPAPAAPAPLPKTESTENPAIPEEKIPAPAAPDRGEVPWAEPAPLRAGRTGEEEPPGEARGRAAPQPSAADTSRNQIVREPPPALPAASQNLPARETPDTSVAPASAQPKPSAPEDKRPEARPAAEPAAEDNPPAARTFPAKGGEPGLGPNSPATKSDASPVEQPHARLPRAEEIRTDREQPAASGRNTVTEFPETTREINGKIVIPTAPPPSEPQNLLRVNGERNASELNVVSGEAKEKEERPHLRARHFLTLSLEELQDQNSTWIPVEGYRIYLSARHRYYGLREIAEIFPLWIYEGELAPEFLDLRKAWKFYDRPPKYYSSLEALPAPVARYLFELQGAPSLELASQKEKSPGAVAGLAPTAPEYFAGTGGRIDSQPPPSAPRPSSTLDKILRAIRSVLGLGG